MSLFRKRRTARRRRERARRESRPEPPPGSGQDRPRGTAGRPLGQALRSSGAAAGRGIEATARRAQRVQPALRRRGGAGLRMLRSAVALVFRIAARAERILFAGIGMVGAAAGGLTARLDRILTPERAVAVVTVAAATCLVVSQFSDYRGVEVGQPAYSEVSSIAPPPMVQVKTAGEAHSYLLIPLAAVAIGLTAGALATRRWRLGRLVALAGLIGIAVVLLIDLPKGLDEGAAGTDYAGAHATLSEGFYAELAASAVLVICGLLLSINLRRARGPARRRVPAGRGPGAGKAPSLARSGP